jgi:hypothetical protein
VSCAWNSVDKPVIQLVSGKTEEFPVARLYRERRQRRQGAGITIMISGAGR